jgi:Rad3-related DNA helicase
MTPAEFIDNPNWADFLPALDRAAKTRALPAHEDCSRIDPESAAMHLRRGGTLGKMDGYEERPGQIDMLAAIVRAYNSREHLMVEAGTGVGKSLAYLIPSVLWAATNDTPVVISTATRNLQSQLIGSDIPRAVQVLGDGAAKFKVALLKGRGNYLCLRAVGEFFAPGFWTMSDDEQSEMPHFIQWLETTPDGDLDNYEGLPRSILTCPGEECSGRRCQYYSRCFVYRARKTAAEADLIVANHSLVLAEATNGNAAILPAYGRLVLDEAHNLEEIATEYLSYEFSMPVLTRLLNRLVRRGKGKRASPGGILSSVERQLAKGILAGTDAGARVRKLLTEASSLVVRIVDCADEILALAESQVLSDHVRDVIRYRGPIEAKDAHARFDSAVAQMVTLLHDLRDSLDASAPPGEINFCADLAVQVGGMADSFVSFANETDFVLSGNRETHVYWAERVKLEKRRRYVRLVAAPLSVADALRRLVYEAKDSVVLSSATLRVGNDFKYMCRRLGFFNPDQTAESRYRCLTATSPFDYLRQCLVLAPDCLPDPAADAAGYSASLAALLKDLFSATAGRALVLFTSYEMMKSVADLAAAPLSEAGIRLLVQGEGLSRESMTRMLKSSDNMVIFGAQSFWEGVDVAGDALSCVVIARLPFAQVGDPVVEARGEKVEREGGSQFRDYALPEAVIRFRQGFGRLIRTKSDHGVVVVTDPRLVTKNYGSVFRRSIPASVHAVASGDELLDRVRGFFAEFLV